MSVCRRGHYRLYFEFQTAWEPPIVLLRQTARKSQTVYTAAVYGIVNAMKKIQIIIVAAACLFAASFAGAEKTASGITITTIKAGTGAQPNAGSTVKVHYRGTLTNGQEFDSSYKRGQPATFPLSQVIRCWTEGVQKIKVGGKAKLVCPANLAYGPRALPGIPANSTLVFEVELLDIVR